MQEVPGSAFQLKADLVLLAMGFLGPRRGGCWSRPGVALDPRGNVLANTVDYSDIARRRCSPRATCGAASRWWCGRSAKAGSARARWTSS